MPVKFSLLLMLVFSHCMNSNHLTTQQDVAAKEAIKTGAEQTDKYLPYLRGKRVAILANQTSVIGKTHLVDSLQSLGIQITKVFGPEHGFRGNASAGTSVADETDVATGRPGISV